MRKNHDTYTPALDLSTSGKNYQQVKNDLVKSLVFSLKNLLKEVHLEEVLGDLE